MIAVGIGSGIDDDELEEIADGKRENAIHVDAFNQLVSNENNILYASCQPGNFQVIYTPSGDTLLLLLIWLFFLLLLFTFVN